MPSSAALRRVRSEGPIPTAINVLNTSSDVRVRFEVMRFQTFRGVSRRC